MTNWTKKAIKQKSNGGHILHLFFLPLSEPAAIQNPKPPSPPGNMFQLFANGDVVIHWTSTDRQLFSTAFCIDYDINCDRWKSMGACESNNVYIKSPLNVYCGVTCDACE